MQTVAVTGAWSFLGRHVARELLGGAAHRWFR